MNTICLNILTKIMTQKKGGLANADRADEGGRGVMQFCCDTKLVIHYNAKSFDKYFCEHRRYSFTAHIKLFFIPFDDRNI